MKKHILLILIFSFLPLMQGCEQDNVFSGIGDRKEEAIADGNKALRGGNYSKALKIFNAILDKDSRNSEALYGKASAELKNAGLDLLHLFNTFLDFDSDNDEEELDFIDEILGGLSLTRLATGSDRAIKDLEKISLGKTDGTIPPDDFDVNINLAIIIPINAFVDMMVEEGVETIDDLENALGGDPLEIGKIQDKLREAKKYAEKAGGDAGKDLAEALEDLIEDLDDW